MDWSANSKKNKGNYQDIQWHQRLMDPIDAMTNRDIKGVRVKWIKEFEQRNVWESQDLCSWLSVWQYWFWFLHCGTQRVAFDKNLFQQLKPKRTEASFGTTRITVTILFIIPVLFSRVKVNELVFVLSVVFFHLILHGTCTMLCVGILHYQQVLCWSVLMAARWFK